MYVRFCVPRGRRSKGPEVYKDTLKQIESLISCLSKSKDTGKTFIFLRPLGSFFILEVEDARQIDLDFAFKLGINMKTSKNKENLIY